MVKKAYSPKDIGQLKTRELEFEGKWEEAFGRPCKTDTWFISGRSASGKSSFVMQLGKELCGYGRVLYVSLEEGVHASFKRRMELFGMEEVQGRFRVVTDGDMETLTERLRKPKSGNFIIIDSIQFTEWDYPAARALVERFPRKCFIFVSQEDKGRPIGKTAVKVKFLAGVKIRTIGFKAYCQGRYINDSTTYYTIWEDGAMKADNSVQ